MGGVTKSFEIYLTFVEQIFSQIGFVLSEINKNQFNLIQMKLSLSN